MLVIVNNVEIRMGEYIYINIYTHILYKYIYILYKYTFYINIHFIHICIYNICIYIHKIIFEINRNHSLNK